MNLYTELILLGIVASLLNILGGMWRVHTVKFSVNWFLAIHLPVLFVIATRFLIETPFVWYSVVLTVSFSVAGQLFGAIIERKRVKI